MRRCLALMAWPINCGEVNGKGGVKQKQKFMVWLGVCLEGTMLLVILDIGSVNHKGHIENVLSLAQ